MAHSVPTPPPFHLGGKIVDGTALFVMFRRDGEAEEGCFDGKGSRKRKSLDWLG